jgi:ribosomal protein L11 methyltransferase
MTSNLFKAHLAGSSLWALAFDIDRQWLDFLSEALSEECLSLSTLTPDPPEPHRMELLLEEKPDPAQWQQKLAPLFAAVDAAVPELAVSEVHDRNWLIEVQASFKPIHAGRFWVHGSHVEEVPPRSASGGDVLPICVDAGLAFGSGEHGTTHGCLMALDWIANGHLDVPDGNWLDVGTGSGVLAMAMARLEPQGATIVATDIDPVAVQVAEENFARNGISGILGIEADGMDHPALARHAPYAVITANILAQPLVHLAPSIAKARAKGGIVILSGLLITQEPMVLPAYEAQGLALKHAFRRDNWSALMLQ